MLLRGGASKPTSDVHVSVNVTLNGHWMLKEAEINLLLLRSSHFLCAHLANDKQTNDRHGSKAAGTRGSRVGALAAHRQVKDGLTPAPAAARDANARQGDNAAGRDTWEWASERCDCCWRTEMNWVSDLLTDWLMDSVIIGALFAMPVPLVQFFHWSWVKTTCVTWANECNWQQKTSHAKSKYIAYS